MAAPPPTIRHLFITLRRGLAGVREDHRSVISSLGLRKREQTVRRRNDAALRGAVEKVRGQGEIGDRGGNARGRVCTGPGRRQDAGCTHARPGLVRERARGGRRRLCGPGANPSLKKKKRPSTRRRLASTPLLSPLSLSLSRSRSRASHLTRLPSPRSPTSSPWRRTPPGRPAWRWRPRPGHPGRSGGFRTREAKKLVGNAHGVCALGDVAERG